MGKYFCNRLKISNFAVQNRDKADILGKYFCNRLKISNFAVQNRDKADIHIINI